MAADPTFGIPLVVLVPLFIWSMAWKGVALWKCGKNNQLAWFVVLFIVNTLGILPIIYVKWFQEKPKKTISIHEKTPKNLPKKQKRKRKK